MTKFKASDFIEIDDEFVENLSKRLQDLKKNDDTELISVIEAAKLLGNHRQTVIRYINSYLFPNKYPSTPKLKAVKIGNAFHILKKDFQEFIKNPKNPQYDEE